MEVRILCTSMLNYRASSLPLAHYVKANQREVLLLHIDRSLHAWEVSPFLFYFNFFLHMIRIIHIPNYFYWLTRVFFGHACMHGLELIRLAPDFGSRCNSDALLSTASATWLHSSLRREGTRRFAIDYFDYFNPSSTTSTAFLN